MPNSYEVIQLKVGYSEEVKLDTGKCYYRADGSITLVKGDPNLIVDTGGPWNRQFIIEALKKHNLKLDDIEYVIGTHGHQDHIGNLNLFPQSTFIVSFDVSKGDHYIDNQLKEDKPFVINANLHVLPTPGHTCSDVSLLVKDSQLGTVVVAGDLFECESDLEDPTLWKENSFNPELQEQHRQRILKIADHIIPGHGPLFRVSQS